MLVEDPVSFLKAKFDNMLSHVESTYPGTDVAALRDLPAPLLLAAVRAHLLPHAEAIKQGRLLDVAQRLADHPDLLQLAERARDDEKLRRYLRLFVELVE